MTQALAGDGAGAIERSDETRSPFERVYRGLIRGIYEARYVPGQRLAAPDLMTEYEVGRGTVREVLHRLASSGVVTVIPNRGAIVRMLSRQETTDILQIVELLLGLAARGAADAIASGQGIEQLEAAFATLKRHERLEDLMAFVDAREDFYRTLVDLGGNRELQRLFPTIQVHIMRQQLRRFDRAVDSTDFGDYAELMDAVRACDPAVAEAVARKHVRHTIDNVMALPDRAFRKI